MDFGRIWVVVSTLEKDVPCKSSYIKAFNHSDIFEFILNEFGVPADGCKDYFVLTTSFKHAGMVFKIYKEDGKPNFKVTSDCPLDVLLGVFRNLFVSDEERRIDLEDLFNSLKVSKTVSVWSAQVDIGSGIKERHVESVTMDGAISYFEKEYGEDLKSLTVMKNKEATAEKSLSYLQLAVTKYLALCLVENDPYT